MIHPPVQLSEGQIDAFHAQGFLILENFLAAPHVQQIADRLDPLFATQFETGVYPDEWHGRPGLSQPNSTRQMSGMWRCDRTVAQFSLSAEIARLNATLMGWSGGRYAMDSCWIKPPDAPEVCFHRNNTALSSINPASVATCWIALSHGTQAAGTLEIVPGSHRWNGSDQFRFLHAPAYDYRAPLWAAAAAMGQEPPEILPIELSPGSCVFLHGDLWHGSGKNTTSDQTRRSFAVSTMAASANFQPPGVGYGYIFSRYRSIGQLAIDESFFPILWTQDGYRTPMVLEYCDDPLTPAMELA